MQIGRLNKRVTVQVRATTQDSFGEVVENWLDTATVWAAVQPLRGAERLAAMQVQATSDIKVTMRYRAGVDPAKRLKFGSRIFDIENVIDIDERHRVLEVMCKEVQ